MTRVERHLRVGVDIGGTFTDLVLIDDVGGQLFSGKVLTTPDDPAAGVLAGIGKVLAQAAARPEAVGSLVHGTTLATNAIIERKGARTALLTTNGFRDILETRRELRYDLYDLFITFPEPLVPRSLRLGMPERTKYDGQVLEPLNAEEVAAALEHLAEQGVESVAVCFLHSYANPANELAARRVIQARQPNLRVSLSCEVLPEVGEYGRVSTTVANAYVQPLVECYLGRLVDALAERGARAPFFVMSSSGGTLSDEVAKRFPVRLVESGPAAGASVASFYAERTGTPRLLAFDMGGTTAKMCLIKDGRPMHTTEFEVSRVQRFQPGSGLLLKVPAVDLIEIGAGGGSIARVDELGLLAVGPDSAGAQPGPACYGRGGGQATVTDADMLLGYLNPAYFLGGEMPLESGRAAKAIHRGVGGPLKLSELQAAASVFEVVNTNMANAADVYAAEKGEDLRDYTLFAFGGAAPAHAWDVARRLGITRVMVPFAAGVLSALGCVLSPLSFDFVAGYMRELERVDWGDVNATYANMERQGREWLAEAGLAGGVMVSRSADMRYLGQRYEVNFALPASGPLGTGHLSLIEETFHAAYRQRFSRDIREVPVEVVSWRLTVTGPRPALDLCWGRNGEAERGDPGPKARRLVFFADAGRHADCPVYDRYCLRPGTPLKGPAVVEDRESTTIIPPGARATVDDLNSLAIELGEAR
jgi:N-methylhydantoinase A